MHLNKKVQNMRIILIIIFFFIHGLAQARTVSDKVEALKSYLLDKDYPEVFKGAKYKINIENIVFADVDNDGAEEAIALYRPHYLQSPTIIIGADIDKG